MANTILTPVMITREALRILHQKCNFIGSINRQYDDQFAKKGAKIGNTLNIRLPNQYTVRSGSTMAAIDTTETQVPLVINSQKGVDVQFSSTELTLSLDDFSDRILKPAMSVLAANIEVDAMSMINQVWQQVNNQGAAINFNKILQGRKILNDALAPMDDLRVANLCTQDNLDLVDTLKGLFQDSEAIKEQYREGMMGRTGGFDFYENTLWPTIPRGAANAAYTVNGAGQTGTALLVQAGAGAFASGEIFTIAGVFKVHPESKVSLGVLQQFTTPTGYAGGAGTMTISPAIVITGPLQNVSAAPGAGAVIVVSGTISTTYGQSLEYHRDAFVFATADMVMPDGVDFSSRQVQDGISMRIVRQYTIANDQFPCRIDVLYGFKAVRPQLAVRLANN